jgi:hypothetical protein
MTYLPFRSRPFLLLKGRSFPHALSSPNRRRRYDPSFCCHHEPTLQAAEKLKSRSLVGLKASS